MRYHYTTLGIAQHATFEEVKNAYRLKARKFHPDKNLGNESTSTQAFQEISEAYQILSDPKKRRRYNQQLSNRRLYSTFTGRSGSSREKDSSFYDPGPFFQAPNPKTSRNPKNGFTNRLDKECFETAVEVPLDTIFSGGWKPCEFKHGTDLKLSRYLIYIEPGCPTGTKKKLQLEKKCNNEIKNIVVLITVKEKKHPTFTRIGENIEAAVELSKKYINEITGVTLTGLDGNPIHVCLPNTDSFIRKMKGKKVLESWTTVPGVGMPINGDRTKRGCLFVKFSFS